MTQTTTTPEPTTSSTWERLEDFVREHVQHFIQALLEEEVTELLGRAKSARREAVDTAPGYRNGYGKPRHGAIAHHRSQTLQESRECDGTDLEAIAGGRVDIP